MTILRPIFGRGVARRRDGSAPRSQNFTKSFPYYFSKFHEKGRGQKLKNGQSSNLILQKNLPWTPPPPLRPSGLWGILTIWHLYLGREWLIKESRYGDDWTYIMYWMYQMNITNLANLDQFCAVLTLMFRSSSNWSSCDISKWVIEVNTVNYRKANLIHNKL